MAGSTYGLPRYVIAILHIMEAHKDCLKWTVSERSHKLSLTLTWDFKYRENKNKKTFWGKLQKTLKGNTNLNTTSGKNAPNANETSEIPLNLIRFIKRLEMETKEDESQQTALSRSQQASMLQRQQRWSRYSLQSLPNRYQSVNQNQSTRSTDPGTNIRYPQSYSQHVRRRNQGMKSYASYHHLTNKDIISPLHSSWPEDSLECSSDHIDESGLPSEVVIASGGPSGTRSAFGKQSRYLKHATNKNIASRNLLTTKSEPYFKPSDKSHLSKNVMYDKSFPFNDLMASGKANQKSFSKTPSGSKPKSNISTKAGNFERTDYRRSASACLNGISKPSGRYNVRSNPPSCKSVSTNRQKEHEHKPLDPKILPKTNAPYLMPTSATDATSDSDSISDIPSEDGPKKQTVNQTVIRCLDSCDKILYRHSTTII